MTDKDIFEVNREMFGHHDIEEKNRIFRNLARKHFWICNFCNDYVKGGLRAISNCRRDLYGDINPCRGDYDYCLNVEESIFLRDVHFRVAHRVGGMNDGR